jgi:hypothetical protein
MKWLTLAFTLTRDCFGNITTLFKAPDSAKGIEFFSQALTGLWQQAAVQLQTALWQ